MTQPIETQGQFFTFNKGHLFGNNDVMAGVSPSRSELVVQGIRPTLQTSLPPLPSQCDTLNLVEVEATGSGMAGGTPGFGVHLWNGFWFHPTPAVTSTPGLTRAKASDRAPAAAYRFGTTADPIYDPANFRAQPGYVRLSTEGASRGALDGELLVTASQTRYACRLNGQR